MRRSILVVLVLLGGLAACSKSSTEPVAQAAQTAPEAQFLRMSLDNEPSYIDPGLTSEASGVQVAQNLFEGLFTPDPETGKPVKALAKSYTVSPNQLTYTFTLRDDARWTNGEPVTAHDFEYSWRRVLNPEVGSIYAFIMYYLKNGQAYNTGEITDASQVGVVALNDTTLQMTLESPTPFMLDLLSRWVFAPVPAKVVEAHGSRWTNPEHIVSNGPFMLKTWVPHKELVVEKNPQYWNAAQTTLAGVRFIPVEDRHTALKMFETGELDIAWNVPEIKIPALLEHQDFVIHPFLADDFLRVNVTRKPFDDVRVRQALALAIDRKTLAENYLQKMKVPTTSIVPPGVGEYESPEGLSFDPQRAQALLAEAGYPGGKGLAPINFYYNTDETLKLMAQVVQQMWKDNLGVEVRLYNEEYKTLIKRTQKLDYDVIRSRWIGDYVDPNTYLELFLADSSINMTGWKNATYDTFVKQAAQTVDPIARYQLLHKAEAVLLQEAPVIPLYVHTKAYMLGKHVKGFYPDIIDYHPLKGIQLVDEGGAAVGKQ